MPGKWNEIGKLLFKAISSIGQKTNLHPTQDSYVSQHKALLHLYHYSAMVQAGSGMFDPISAWSIQSTMAWLSVKICHKHLALCLDKGANEFVAIQENLKASFFTKLLLACCNPTNLMAMQHHGNMELMEWLQMTCCCLCRNTHSSDFHQGALWPWHLTHNSKYQSAPHDFLYLNFLRKTPWETIKFTSLHLGDSFHSFQIHPVTCKWFINRNLAKSRTVWLDSMEIWKPAVFVCCLHPLVPSF